MCIAVMALAGQHDFQILTKRAGRMRAMLNSRRFRQLVADQCVDLIADRDSGYWGLRWPLGSE